MDAASLAQFLVPHLPYLLKGAIEATQSAA